MTRLQGSEEERVVRAALEAFWQRGYDGASYAALMEATGLGKTSLYAAFGDKRALYLKALEHYVTREVAEAAALLLGCGGAGRPPPSRRRPARQIMRALHDIAIFPLESSNDTLSDRRGCFLCNAAVEQAPDDPEVAQLVTKGMSSMRSALEETVTQALGERTAGIESSEEPEGEAAASRIDVFDWAKSLKSKPVEEASFGTLAMGGTSSQVRSKSTPQGSTAYLAPGGARRRAAPSPPSAKDTAEHLLSLYVGLRVMAKAGTPAARLKRARDAALSELN